MNLFRFILGVVLGFSVMLAQAEVVEPKEKLAESWLQELYDAGLEAKKSADPQGLCKGAQGIYSIKLPEPPPSDTDEETRRKHSEEILKTIMETVDTKMTALIKEKSDQYKNVKRIVISAGRVFVENKEDVASAVGHAVEDRGFSEMILDRGEEFTTRKKEMFRAGVAYGDEITRDISLIRFFGVIDFKAQDIFIIGDGDNGTGDGPCEL